MGNSKYGTILLVIGIIFQYLLIPMPVASATQTKVFDQTVATNEFTEQILINGNEEFYNVSSIYGWTGTGEAQNPIIIENYALTTPNSPRINISNTDLHFIIRNCTELSDLTPNHPRLSIALNNISNVILENNMFYFGVNLNKGSQITFHQNHLVCTFFCIRANEVSDVLIRSNDLDNSGEAIKISASETITITENTITEHLLFFEQSIYPFTIHQSEFVLITNNNITGGSASILDSKDITIQQNIFDITFQFLNASLNSVIIDNVYMVEDPGLWIEYSNNTWIHNNTIKTRNRGININKSFYGRISYNVITYRTNIMDVGIFLSHSQLDLDFNQISHADFGIYLYKSSNSSMFFNSITGSKRDGINLRYSSFVYIESNIVDHNRNGLMMTGSNSNSIINNSIENNSNSGIVLINASYNIFRGNSIKNNQIGFNVSSTSVNNTHQNTFFDMNLNNILIDNTSALEEIKTADHQDTLVLIFFFFSSSVLVLAVIIKPKKANNTRLKRTIKKDKLDPLLNKIESIIKED